MDVRFIDFDWAGQAGVIQYPSFRNHQGVPWPAGVKEGARALQIHDKLLLRRHLPAVSTAALLKLPVKQQHQAQLVVLWHTRHPLAHACRPF